MLGCGRCSCLAMPTKTLQIAVLWTDASVQLGWLVGTGLNASQAGLVAWRGMECISRTSGGSTVGVIITWVQVVQSGGSLSAVRSQPVKKLCLLFAGSMGERICQGLLRGVLSNMTISCSGAYQLTRCLLWYRVPGV